MALECAQHSPTCALTETCMYFGIHSIHLKRQIDLLWSKLCQAQQDT